MKLDEDPRISEFVERARATSVQVAAENLGLSFTGARDEHPQPCPSCGGTDCFAFNTRKNVWNCRAAGEGGGDAIGMAAHSLGLDLKIRSQFLEACSAVLSEVVPSEDEKMDAQEKLRLKRQAEKRKQDAAIKARDREKQSNDFREREQSKARGIYEGAKSMRPQDVAARYLALRCSLDVGEFNLPHTRQINEATYWHGQDERGHAQDCHVGPAMIHPLIDENMQVLGCHQTWIDLRAPNKYRPEVKDPLGKLLPTKKMRGSKKGCLIPLSGPPEAPRWVGGEGIENTLAVAVFERFRSDTFYFAAGDLGNLAGPSARKGRFKHPTKVKEASDGSRKPVFVQSPDPDLDRLTDAFWILPSVTEITLVADGDSDAISTATAMVRARQRILALYGQITVHVLWPPNGFDFSDIAVGRVAA